MERRHLLILLFLLIAIVSYSQDISVRSFKLLDTDLTANTPGTSEVDQNGETAALIKVVTTEKGFSFDCGMLGIVKTKQTPGEIWVYLPLGAQKITIKHPQLGVLRNYYFPTSIEGARTYEMVLTTGKVLTVVKETRKTQYVVFQLSPSNAVVELNGELLPTNDGVATKMIKFGTYEYKVQALNYLPQKGKITIDDPNNKKIVDINLQPNFSIVTLSVGNNAEIWVNGEMKGKASWTGNLGAGTYEFEAKKENHRSTTMMKDIVVTAEPQFYNLEDPTPIFGEVDINSTPAMANIYIDAVEYGQTPNVVPNILIGSHQLRIVKEGYEPHNQEIVIEEDKPFELLVQLNKLSEHATKTKLFSELINSKNFKKTGKKTQDGAEYYGEIKKGKPNGLGMAIYSNRNTYEGEFVDGKRHGYGIFKTYDGERYEGDWLDDQRHGKGVFVNLNGDKYEGDWAYGKKHGHGVMTYYSGHKYNGEWVNDKCSGRGKYTFTDGSYYDGEWKDNMRNGKGRYVGKDGTEYDGEWSEDVYWGTGSYKSANGDVYVGQWRYGRKNGRGKYTFKGGAKYEGDFVDDQPDGEGIYEFAYGDKYTGHFKKGKRDGLGTLTKEDGTVIKGQWKNDKFIKGETYQQQAPIDRKMKEADAMILRKIIDADDEGVSETSSSEIHYHKVKKGETLQSIARKHGMTVDELCRLNGIGRNIKLNPGQILKYH